MVNKEILFDFLNKQKLAVISTVGSDSKPESAVLEFGQTDKLELIFDTFNTSRKYKNLQTNKDVALVIGWDENITVQYEGIALELIGDEAEKYKKIFWTKNPEAERWDKRKGIVYFKVVPSWIRYSDLNKNPWEIFEVETF